MGRRIVVLLVAVFAVAIAFSAIAAPLFFHMAGAICTSASESGSPVPCHHVTAMVEMEDGYVPGTPRHRSCRTRLLASAQGVIVSATTSARSCLLHAAPSIRGVG